MLRTIAFFLLFVYNQQKYTKYIFYFNKIIPFIAGVCLPVCASAVQVESAVESKVEVLTRSASRKMKALLSDSASLQAMQRLPLSPADQTPSLSAEDFLLRNYNEVAISTDLEPDDVLALAILFEEANRMYKQSPDGKYPIDLIVVGEGNTAIKRMRMEKLLQEYFDIPVGIDIKIVEGKSTKDNVFSYDGEEFFDPEALGQIPFPESDPENRAAKALQIWAEQAKNPFIIQLKPASELLYLPSDVASKTSVLFYGSFNIRKTVLDSDICNDSQFEFARLPIFSAQLNGLMSHLSGKFSKIAILETFGVLGDQASVCSEFDWTHGIARIIDESDDSFMEMFRTLSSNWNAYILDKFLGDCERISAELAQGNSSFADFFTRVHSDITQLQKEWSQDQFDNLYKSLSESSAGTSAKLNGEMAQAWKTMMRKMSLAKKISTGIQFTLADILVSLATTDHSNLFQAMPVKASYDENGFLIPIADSKSNIVYYGTVNREKLADVIEQFLHAKIARQANDPPIKKAVFLSNG